MHVRPSRRRRRSPQWHIVPDGLLARLSSRHCTMYAACRGTWSAQRAAWVGRTAPAAGRGRLSRRSLAAELIIGCDLGTSNSAAAAIDKETGAARVLRGPDGNASVPSVVAIAQARYGRYQLAGSLDGRAAAACRQPARPCALSFRMARRWLGSRSWTLRLATPRHSAGDGARQTAAQPSPSPQQTRFTLSSA